LPPDLIFQSSKFDFGWGFARPVGEAHSAPQTFELDFRSPISKRRERKKREEKKEGEEKSKEEKKKRKNEKSEERRRKERECPQFTFLAKPLSVTLKKRVKPTFRRTTT